MDNRTLLRRTLIAVGATVGGCVLLVGTLTIVASVVVNHAVGAKEDSDGGVAAVVPGTGLHPPAAGVKPVVGSTATQRN